MCVPGADLESCLHQVIWACKYKAVMAHCINAQVLCRHHCLTTQKELSSAVSPQTLRLSCHIGHFMGPCTPYEARLRSSASVIGEDQWRVSPKAASSVPLPPHPKIAGQKRPALTAIAVRRWRLPAACHPAAAAGAAASWLWRRSRAAQCPRPGPARTCTCSRACRICSSLLVRAGAMSAAAFWS